MGCKCHVRRTEGLPLVEVTVPAFRCAASGLGLGLEEMEGLETRALTHTMGMPDAIEGGLAWFEKRDPQWQSQVSRDWPDWMD